MAYYRKASDGSYELQSNVGWMTYWNPAPAGWTPSSSDTEYGGAKPSNPSHGEEYFTSSGTKQIWNADLGKWQTPTSFLVATTGSTAPTITGDFTYTSSGVYTNDDTDRSNPMTMEQAAELRNASKLPELQALFEPYGYTVDYSNGQYLLKNQYGKAVYASNSSGMIRDYYQDNLYTGPKYSGNLWDPYGDDTIGVLESQHPGGTTTPIWVGEGPAPPGTSPFNPTPTTTGSTGSPPTGTGGNDSPFNVGTRPGMTLNTVGGDYPYNPPEGIPLNPLVFENPMKFSPYGTPAASFSNIAQFGGLPRSTGPWNEMGGYYGGNPYTTPPEGHYPPSSGQQPYMPIDSPWDGGIGGGGQPPVDSDSPWLPPAQPITFPNQNAAPSTPGSPYGNIPGYTWDGGAYVPITGAQLP